MNRDEAQELIDKKDFTKYSFEYLDGYVDAMNIMESSVCDDCKNKIDGTYQEICSNCKRFYGCYFEAKKM